MIFTEMIKLTHLDTHLDGAIKKICDDKITLKFDYAWSAIVVRLLILTDKGYKKGSFHYDKFQNLKSKKIYRKYFW